MYALAAWNTNAGNENSRFKLCVTRIPHSLIDTMRRCPREVLDFLTTLAVQYSKVIAHICLSFDLAMDSAIRDKQGNSDLPPTRKQTTHHLPLPITAS